MNTHVAVVLDESGSMQGIKNTLLPVFNDLTKVITDEPNTFLTFITFSTSVNVRFTGEKGARIPLSPNQYQPSGQTALLDAIVRAVEELSTIPAKEGDAYLVMVFTDGEENASRRFTPTLLESLIKSKQDSGNWTFAVQVPPGKAKSYAMQYGIPSENVREWEATTQGTESAGWYAKTGVSDYFTSRRSGVLRSSNFYAQQPNVHEVKRELVDLSSSYHKARVNRESSIKEYVEDVLRLPYQIGGSFYQLTKRETIQSNKLVLVEDKKTGAVYGGIQARNLIGLPSWDEKVSPSENGPYNIYIQSTSTNRKLIPGTQILVRR